MRNEMIAPLHQWLKDLSVAVPASYLQHKLNTHPEYPSLASITDLLDDLGIENGAYVVNKHDWDDLPLPFLAHLNAQQAKLVIVRKEDKAELGEGGRLQDWDGIAVFAEKPVDWKNKEVDNYIQQQQKKNGLRMLSATLLLISSVLVLYPSFDATSIFLLLTSIAGLALSIMIVQKELGFRNVVTEKLCSLQGDEGCDAVISSKGSKIGASFSWSDAGIMYFSSYLLLLVSHHSLLPVYTAMAVPFTFFSLYYQWKIIGKWCTLCLLTLAVTSLQFALQWTALATLTVAAFNVPSLAFAVFTLALITILWLGLIRPLLKDRETIAEDKFRLLRFRHNPNVFQSLLHQQKKVNVTPWVDDLQIGNAASQVQIMVACNAYCAPCAKTHQLLHELSEKNHIGITVRFTSNPSVKDDMRTEAVTYLLRLLSGKSTEFKRGVLHDWYALMNLQQFSLRYPLDSLYEVDDELYQHQQWIDDARVAVTPTLFINGYEMPKEYTVEDLLPVLRGMPGTAVVSEMETT